MNAETQLTRLKLVLPPTPKPGGLYRPLMVVGNMAYLSGHVPLRADGSRIVGRLGADMDLESGKAAARQCGLAILATLRAHPSSFDRVKRVVKLLGFVNATAEFQQHAQVLNGCSELFAEFFGEEQGVGARSAVGMSSLPGGVAVEIEAIFELI